MNTEPSRIVSAITAAITAVIGLLTVLGVWREEVAGAVTIVAAAIIVAAGEVIRSRVSPVQPEPEPISIRITGTSSKTVRFPPIKGGGRK